MLTHTHNHAPRFLLCLCSCHRNEKQKSESFFNYDTNLTSVITTEPKFIFFFAMLVSLYGVIRCDAVNIKNFREILSFFFLNSGYAPPVLPIAATVETINFSFLLKLIVCFMFCQYFHPLLKWKEVNIQNNIGFFVQYILFKSKTLSET